MAVSSDVSIAQSGGNSRFHPSVVALLRWCVSCVWSAAAVLLHRLMTAPLPQITAKAPARPPSYAHLRAEPRVSCAVLRRPDAPARHELDFIFIHGLYGSLENTWRQGEWRMKYKIEPEKVNLLRPTSIPEPSKNNIDNIDLNEIIDNNVNDVDEKVERVDNAFIGNNAFQNNKDMYITEQFYCDKVEIIDNYEMQAEFVRDLFNSEHANANIYNGQKGEMEINEKENEFKCKCGPGRCVGCGCICDKCYSACWPKDWLQEDFPGARIISINYTSDPYLWRPLWIKGCKRLSLMERADQMIDQLIELGVGTRPIVWVGHSKGGLFIKQMYCEAYEAYKKLNPNFREDTASPDRHTSPKTDISKTETDETHLNVTLTKSSTETTLNEMSKQIAVHETRINELNESQLKGMANIWRQSVGFMFYSVPHRGSPLADIKTPITARSLELLEISKDNALVLSLQARWLAAARPRAPLVRSLVETRRTLMAVLWLRIVSAESADAGVGALCGIPLDHREICKPSSRRCILYRELVNVARSALARTPDHAPLARPPPVAGTS